MHDPKTDERGKTIDAVHEGVALKIATSVTSFGTHPDNEGWIRDEHHNPIARDLCNYCVGEMKAQILEIWESTKPEALKLREVK
jgi:hypothetical protein